MFSSTVSTCRGGNLKAMAQRGALAVQPSARCCGDGIDLRHDAVDLIRQLVALGLALLAERQQLVDAGAKRAVWVDLEAHSRQRFERLPMAFARRLPIDQQEVGVEVELARCRNARLENAQRAGRRIARVRVAGQFLPLALGVQALEGLAVHDHFAARFEKTGAVADAQRQAADGARVFGDVLASARRRA